MLHIAPKPLHAMPQVPKTTRTKDMLRLRNEIGQPRGSPGSGAFAPHRPDSSHDPLRFPHFIRQPFRI